MYCMAKNVKNSDLIELITQQSKNNKKSRWPAKLDNLQSMTGILLVLFLMGHLLFDALIIFGDGAMYKFVQFTEMSFIFDGGTGFFVSLLSAFILGVITIHAALGIRQMPGSYRKFKAINTLTKTINHLDSRLWILQVITGFILFFTVSIHVFMKFLNPTDIGPYLSADRFYSEHMWIFYIILLVAVVLHAFVGLYRVALKKGLFGLSDAPSATRTFDKKFSKIQRTKLAKVRNYLIMFYLIIGFVSIAVYTYKGYEHRYNVGEKYEPSKAVLAEIKG